MVVWQGGDHLLPQTLQRNNLQQDRHNFTDLQLRTRSAERKPRFPLIHRPYGAETWPSSLVWQRRHRCTRWSSALQWAETPVWWRRWPCRNQSPEPDHLQEKKNSCDYHTAPPHSIVTCSMITLLLLTVKQGLHHASMTVKLKCR